MVKTTTNNEQNNNSKKKKRGEGGGARKHTHKQLQKTTTTNDSKNSKNKARNNNKINTNEQAEKDKRKQISNMPEHRLYEKKEEEKGYCMPYTHTHAHKKEIRLITKNRRLQLPSEDPWRISPVCNKGGAASSSTR